MGRRALRGCLLAALGAAALAGCARQDGSAVLGRWHAERFDLMGLKLPIAPDITISRDKLVMEGSELPIAAITQDGDEVVLDTTGGIGLTLHVVDQDRMYVQLPFVDRIYFRRVKTAAPAPAQPALAQARPASSAPPAPAATPERPPAPVAAPAPAYAQAYDAALQAARRGERDAALRHLHQAVGQGFDRADLLAREPGFAFLRSDPRYQVIALSIPSH